MVFYSKGVKMYKRKTQDEYTIQGNYGQGYEDVTSEDTYKEAKTRLKEYRDNEPQYSHRLIRHRIPINC
jgi:hypothetical protein